MKNNFFKTKISIQKIEKRLSDLNVWEDNYVHWSDMWANITIKDLSTKKCIYLFTLTCRKMLPKKFRIIVQDKIFIPTQQPISDYKNNVTLFHAKVA